MNIHLLMKMKGMTLLKIVTVLVIYKHGVSSLVGVGGVCTSDSSSELATETCGFVIGT
jgi:hypothetical protein